MKKAFYLGETINIIAWANQLTEEKVNALPIKVRWALKKATSKIAPDVKEFEEFRSKLVQDLQDEYFNSDEKSADVVRDVVDENGDPMFDETGAAVTETLRQVKEEYMDEFNAKVAEINEKLAEVASERNEYDITGIDMDAFVDSLPDDTPLEFRDIEMLNFISEDE